MGQYDRCIYCKQETSSGAVTTDGEILCDDCCDEMVDWEGEDA